MNYDGSFGGRPAPSLAEAMMSAQRGYSSMNSPCTTPNAFSRPYYSRRSESYSQQPIGCRFGCYSGPRVEELLDSDDDSNENEYRGENRALLYEERRRKKKQDKMIKKVEETVCTKLETTLKQHYKVMKNKLKSVQQKVESTDASIERLSKLLDAVTESVVALPDISITPITSSQNQQQRIPFTQPPRRPALTWRRKRVSNGRNKVMSQSELDSLYF